MCNPAQVSLITSSTTDPRLLEIVNCRGCPDVTLWYLQTFLITISDTLHVLRFYLVPSSCLLFIFIVYKSALVMYLTSQQLIIPLFAVEHGLFCNYPFWSTWVYHHSGVLILILYFGFVGHFGFVLSVFLRFTRGTVVVVIVR